MARSYGDVELELSTLAYLGASKVATCRRRTGSSHLRLPAVSTATHPSIVHRADRTAVVASLIGVTALAWLPTVQLASAMPMSPASLPVLAVVMIAELR